MKIATYNINGINGRLENLLRWLKEAKPDIVCLQELKATTDKFPESALKKAGYNSVWLGQKSWNGVAILAKGMEIKQTQARLPGDKDDIQSRYIEVIVNQMVIGCLYLPNGNPAPGPKFDYKLKWFKRITAHAKKLLSYDIPVALIGDFNVMPTELDVYKPERWEDDALFRPEVRRAFSSLLKQGWTDAIRKLYRTEKIYTFWDYLRDAFGRDAGLRLDHFLLSSHLEKKLIDAGVDRHVRAWDHTSDHAPVWITLDRKTPEQPLTKKAARKKEKEPIMAKEPKKRVSVPDHISPMLCTLVKEPTDNDEYLYEVKWDGYRIISSVSGDKVAMGSRSGIDYTTKYPRVAKALAKLGHDAVIDGEVVVFDKTGNPDFDALQLYNGHDSPISYCVFDLLYLDGHNLMDAPLTERKELLELLVKKDKTFVFSRSYDDGPKLYQEVLAKNWEGIVAKRKDSPYAPGARGNDWLKVPTRKRQEFVIGGWAESSNGRSFKSLLFGAYKGKKLEWIGRSGGGYKDKEMPGILKELKALEVDESPFANKVLDTKGAVTHWVKPVLVANFEFATWTKTGRIRKPATFLGFRKDKKAIDVVRETPKATPKSK